MTNRRLQSKTNFYYNGADVMPSPNVLPPIDIPRKSSQACTSHQITDLLSSCPSLETARVTPNEDFTIDLRDYFSEDDIEPSRGISLQIWEESPLRVLACEIGRFLISLIGSSWNTMCLANFHFEDSVLLTDMFSAKINNLHDLFATDRLKVLQQIHDDPETADRLKNDLLRLKTKLRTTLKTGIVEYVTFQPASPSNERMYFLAFGHLDGCELLRSIFEQYTNLCRVLLRTVFHEKGSLREIQDVIIEMQEKALEASEQYRRDRGIQLFARPGTRPSTSYTSRQQVVLGTGHWKENNPSFASGSVMRVGSHDSKAEMPELREKGILSKACYHVSAPSGEIKTRAFANDGKRLETTNSVRFNKLVKVRCYEPGLS